ncbi:MAG: hypothetical protein ACRYGI_17640 [Janthinobacterium lividum]
MIARFRRVVSYASALTFIALVALSTTGHDQHARQATAALTNHATPMNVASMGFDPYLNHHYQPA